MDKQTIAKLMDKCYPGFLDEQRVSVPTVRAVQFEGGSEAMFVQLEDVNLIDSAALLDANSKEKSFQSLMLTSNGVRISRLDSGCIISTSTNSIKGNLAQVSYPDAGCAKAVKKIDLGIGDSLGVTTDGASAQSAIFKEIGFRVQTIGKSAFTSFVDEFEITGINYNFRKFFTECFEQAKAAAASMNLTPALMWSVGGDTTLYASNNSWDPVANLPLLEWKDAKVLPSIPGYSRFFFRYGNSGAMFGSTDGLVFSCYVVGSSEIDYFYGDVALQQGSWNKFGLQAIVSNNLDTRPDHVMKFTSSLGTSHPALKLGSSELKILNQVSTRHVGSTGKTSIMLFGPPNARIFGYGNSITDEVLVDEGDERKWNCVLTTIKVSDLVWELDKKWYTDYLKTGYYIFNPAASNIQANVLKQWDALEYDIITIRSKSEVYTPVMTVSTLPEALEYAKARSKACKTNDWLSQIAVVDDSITWGGIQSKLNTRGGRRVWMNVQAEDVKSVEASPSLVSETVVYTKAGDGSISRQPADGTSSTVNLNDDDDMSQLIYDRYFNSKASVVNATWDDLYTPDEMDKLYLSDKAGSFSSTLVGDLSAKVIGFGNWIDPASAANIDAMSEEQKFRLHIRNMLYFDKMSAPLIKVLESFGYKTLIKRI